MSSPSDVAPERGRVRTVAAKLSREYAGLVQFEALLWEKDFYTADQSYQPQIPEAATFDIVVSIFWTRVGSPLPADFARMPDGRPYPSGSAYELFTALAACRHGGAPAVYVFRKTADATLSTADPERRREAHIQLDALEAFWTEWFKPKDEFKAAYQPFTSTDAFEQQLEQLLRQWLDKHGLLGPRTTWPKENGSPFRGLAPFEAEHAAVFFGRDRVIDECRRCLAGAAERGTPFLLLVGASGAGKSSVARAGLIPRLTMPGVVASVDLWRVGRMKPGEGQAGPLMALATALLAPDALPELAQGDYPTAAALADNLRRGGAASAQPIARALERIAEEARRSRHADRPLNAALVLLVDQLEELFAQGTSDDERAAFAESLQRLVATGRVWVIATLRADLYESLLKLAALKALKETGASLDLGPPGSAELAEIVRAPAAAAGLAFEAHPEKGELGERLLADAKTADSLPLLQFTLRQLYDKRDEVAGGIKLTHAVYDALGGLAGAIAAEAERAVSSLPPEAVAMLPKLLRRLAEPAREGKALTLREALRAEVAREPSPEAALVDALLQARILIARTDAGGRPTVRLAHDAVLASWPRASEAAQASREFYRVRAEVEEALRRWRTHHRPVDRLIQPGVPLAEAERLVADFEHELPAELTAYVAASRYRARRRQRLVGAAAVFFFGLAVAATATGILAYHKQQEAVAAERRALAALDDASNVSRVARSRSSRTTDDLRRKIDELLDWAPSSWSNYLVRERAATYSDAGAFEKERADLDAALGADPDRKSLLAASSDNHVVTANAAGAVRDARKAVAISQSQAVVHGNLILGEAMLRNYASAIAQIDEALQKSQPLISDVESLVAPEIQEVIRGFKLDVRNTDFLLGLSYLKAALLAMNGDEGFSDLLGRIDASDRDYPYSRTAYLAALNWIWIISRGQALQDAQAGADKPQSPASERLVMRDFGAYAAQAALWARVAVTRPDFAGHAATAVTKFRTAYKADPQARYAKLAEWVERTGDKSIRSAPEPASPLSHALDLDQRALELRRGPNALNDAHFSVLPVTLLAEAIRLFDRDRLGRGLGRRETDVLVGLLLRRGDWRLASGDLGGASLDAHRVLQINDKIGDAHRLLGDAAFTAAERRTHYEGALALDDSNTEAMSGLIRLLEADDPKAALSLMQIERKHKQYWSLDFVRLARLESKVGRHREALDAIEQAIARAPWNRDYYAQRRAYEVNLGRDAVSININQVRGYHKRARYYAETGKDAQALTAYVEAFRFAARLPDGNRNARLELDGVIHDFSAFLTARFGHDEAVRWWRSFSKNAIATDRERALSGTEMDRLTDAR